MFKSPNVDKQRIRNLNYRSSEVESKYKIKPSILDQNHDKLIIKNNLETIYTKKTCETEQDMAY